MTPLEIALNNTLKHEGGFVDDPVDRGGATKWGITEGTARIAGYSGPMRDLPRDKALDIYRRRYWASRKLNLDVVAAWHVAAATELFDTAVNMGVNTAARFLQNALNALNRNEELYLDIKVDGWAGKDTMKCLHYLIFPYDKATLVKMLNVQQGAKYMKLMRKNSEQERFARGWFNRVEFAKT